MTLKWNFQQPTKEQILRGDELAKKFGIHPAVSILMVQRGITTDEEAKRFLHPSLNDLHDPFLYPDMQLAVDRLNRAIGNKEKILIYGDYDVDGTTAVALVYKFLEINTWSANLDYYIPDRYDEGYGISERGIEYARKNGVSLVIALDCGIKAIENVALAKSLGIDFIICDHHKPDETLPDAVAVLDALCPKSEYPYEYLSGCGVGFKFMHAFAISNGIEFARLRPMLDYVAVSIASDVVPLTGENRVMAHFGIKQLNSNPSKGLKGIIDICGLSGKELSISDIVFKIGPRINASGRMMKGRESVDLLLARDFESAKEKSENVDQYNDDRRELDKKTTDEAYEIIAADPDIEKRSVIIVYHPEWHKGVIGIVASRLTEKYFKPAVVLTESNGFVSGSARSITGFDIYRAIESCRDLLVNFGGHPFAAGVTLEEKNLAEFCSRIDAFATEFTPKEQQQPSIDIDMELQFSEINFRLLHDQKLMNPFGPSNQKPVFMTRQVRDVGTSKIVGRELEHIKLDLVDDSTEETMSAIAFGMASKFDIVSSGKPFNICYTIEENNYNNRISLQLLIKDIGV